MGAIIVGLRPGDHARLKQLAERQGRPPTEVAGIYLERAIRRARAPTDTQSEAPTGHPDSDLTTTTAAPSRG